jgi:hypothetical protein
MLIRQAIPTRLARRLALGHAAMQFDTTMPLRRRCWATHGGSTTQRSIEPWPSGALGRALLPQPLPPGSNAGGAAQENNRPLPISASSSIDLYSRSY